MVRVALGGRRMEMSLTSPERKTLLQPVVNNRPASRQALPQYRFLFLGLFMDVRNGPRLTH